MVAYEAFSKAKRDACGRASDTHVRAATRAACSTSGGGWRYGPFGLRYRYSSTATIIIECRKEFSDLSGRLSSRSLSDISGLSATARYRSGTKSVLFSTGDADSFQKAYRIPVCLGVSMLFRSLHRAKIRIRLLNNGLGTFMQNKITSFPNHKFI